MKTLTPNPAKIYPEWRSHRPFHLHSKKELINCQCGGDRFVFGSTLDLAYCLKCEGEIDLQKPNFTPLGRVSPATIDPRSEQTISYPDFLDVDH